MIGLVIVTHGGLAHELRRALEHVVGPQSQLEAVSIGPDDDTGCRCADVHAYVEAVDKGEGVILLTDMFGGTPSNICIAQMVRPGVEVMSGVNLPMLVKLAKVRSSLPMPQAVEMAQAAGRKYIAAASDVLPHCREGWPTLATIARRAPEAGGGGASAVPGPQKPAPEPSPRALGARQAPGRSAA